MFFVGNIMIDTLVRNLKKAKSSTILEELKLTERRYALVTLHRPSNVDDPIVLRNYLEVFEIIGQEFPLIFPVHPRTRKNITKFGFTPEINKTKFEPSFSCDGGLKLIEPIGYLNFLKLMASARVVLTDSGGIQEETTFLKVPCITLRENTERPVTIEMGTNILVGKDPKRIMSAFDKIMKNSEINSDLPELWDGHAAERIVRVLLNC